MTAPTQVTQYQTGVAPELAPYVQQTLGAQAGRTYTYEKDAQGNPVLDENGMPKITGFQPYQKYEGQRVADFTNLQKKAFEGAENLGYDPRSLAAATGIETLAQKAGNISYTPGQYGIQSFTQPGTAAQYMSPYMQNVVDIQKREAQRSSDIMGQQNAARAVGQGAFGGSRSALVEAERQRNLATQMGDIQATGQQAAYNQAMQQFNAEQQARQQGEQLTEQSRQYGAGLGLQGLQTGLTGYGNLANVGQNLYGQNVGNINLQNQVGTQQQQRDQSKLDVNYSDWMAKQNYPQQQMDTLMSYVRGTPMTTTSQAQYTAAPSTGAQLAGYGLTGAAIYNAANRPYKQGGKVQSRAAGLGALALSKMG